MRARVELSFRRGVLLDIRKRRVVNADVSGGGCNGPLYIYRPVGRAVRQGPVRLEAQPVGVGL